LPKLKFPRCGSTNTAPIVYGLPADNLIEAAQRGEIELGGFFGTKHRLLIEPEPGGCLLRYARNDIFPDFSEMEASGWDELTGQAYMKKKYTPADWLEFSKKLDRCEIKGYQQAGIS